MKCCTSYYQPYPQQEHDEYDKPNHKPNYNPCHCCKQYDDDDEYDKCKKHDDDEYDKWDKCKKHDDDDKYDKCKKCKKHDEYDKYDKVNRWYPCCPCYKHDQHKKPSYPQPCTMPCGCKPPQMPPCYKYCPPCYKPPCYEPPKMPPCYKPSCYEPPKMPPCYKPPYHKPPYTPPTMPGGSTEFHPLTSHDTYVFDTAIANLMGVSYEPLLVSTQVVNGTNYTFIAKATATTNPPKTYYVMITVFEALPSAGGTITLDDIKPITN